MSVMTEAKIRPATRRANKAAEAASRQPQWTPRRDPAMLAKSSTPGARDRCSS